MEHQLRAIRNPFKDLDRYHCFGCDPDSPIGLKLEFARDGDAVVAKWEPRADLEGYPGVIHGGIQATLADEIGGWFIYAVLGTAGVTRSLSMRYKKPALTEEGPFSIRATGSAKDKRSAQIHVELINASGAVCTTAECDYAIFPEDVARKRLFFPGREAFYAPEE